jgi:hypothetical protein
MISMEDSTVTNPFITLSKAVTVASLFEVMSAFSSSYTLYYQVGLKFCKR